MTWGSLLGLPKFLITNGGSHFQCEVLQSLTKVLSIHHHITTAYHPASNGQVERVNRALLYMTRGMISELQLNPQDWETRIPAIQFVLNHESRRALNHHTPIEIMTGRIPSTPVEMTTWNGILMQDTSKIPITCGMITKYIKDMKQAIHELHSEVTDKDRHLRNLRLKTQKKQ